MKTDIDARWAIAPDVRATYSEDGAVLLDHYGTPYQQLLADTEECLDSLRQLGLAHRNGRTVSSLS